MSKKKFSESGWREDTSFRALCRAFLQCKTERQVADFLRDVGTLSELKAWSERLEVARLLQSGRTYRTIASVTGASTTTVTRVADFLENGEGGYASVLSDRHHHSLSPSPSAHRATEDRRGERMVSKA